MSAESAPSISNDLLVAQPPKPRLSFRVIRPGETPPPPLPPPSETLFSSAAPERFRIGTEPVATENTQATSLQSDAPPPLPPALTEANGAGGSALAAEATTVPAPEAIAVPIAPAPPEVFTAPTTRTMESGVPQAQPIVVEQVAVPSIPKDNLQNLADAGSRLGNILVADRQKEADKASGLTVAQEMSDLRTSLRTKAEKQATEGIVPLDRLVKTNLENAQKRVSGEAIAENMSTLREQIKNEDAKAVLEQRQAREKTVEEADKNAPESSLENADKKEPESQNELEGEENTERHESEASILERECAEMTIELAKMSLELSDPAIDKDRRQELSRERRELLEKMRYTSQQQERLQVLEDEETEIGSLLSGITRGEGSARKLGEAAVRLEEIEIEKMYVRTPTVLLRQEDIVDTLERKLKKNGKLSTQDAADLMEAQDMVAMIEAYNDKVHGKPKAEEESEAQEEEAETSEESGNKVSIKRLPETPRPSTAPSKSESSPSENEPYYVYDQSGSSYDNARGDFELGNRERLLAGARELMDNIYSGERQNLADVEALLSQELYKGKRADTLLVSNLKKERLAIQGRMNSVSDRAREGLSDEILLKIAAFEESGRKLRDEIAYGPDRSLWGRAREAVTSNPIWRAGEWFVKANPMKKAAVGAAALGAFFYGPTIMAATGIAGLVAISAGAIQGSRSYNQPRATTV